MSLVQDKTTAKKLRLCFTSGLSGFRCLKQSLIYLNLTCNQVKVSQVFSEERESIARESRRSGKATKA